MPVMWEISSLPSHRESVRRILTYALAALFVAFLWVILLAPTTHAADASWSGSSINYQANTYLGPAASNTLKQLNLLDKTKAYTYVDPAPTGTGTSTSNATRYMHVIYFAPDVDVSTATGAKYKTYVYQGPSSFSEPTNPIDISITTQAAATTAGTTSCDVDNGLGWIICPVTNTLAAGMDWVFNILSGFLAVRPAGTGQDTALFRAWSYMRSFANVAFVISFLIIIYSQLTNVGITNYSIKKLLPRLIIAAILVNLSYYICSIAIDISNILGYSLQDVFIQIRNSLVGTGGNSWNLMSWQSLSGFILSGGTAATVGGIALFSTLSTYGLVGSIILLLPALVIGLTGVLVALLIMAARQAIITLLVILAPLAFVAYLLPNTEKWFEKWRSTFMTMLILFPAFSVVFGGSQLAATAIIQNADSINLVILGLLVQVAPLLITPLLIKLSGSLLGKIAGVINNPNKGMIDRTRNFAKDRADDRKAQRLGEATKRHQFLRRNAQRVDHNRRKREGVRKNHEGMADNRFAGSYDGAALHEAQHEIETAKKTIEERLSRELSMKIQVNTGMLKKEMEMRVVTDEAATEKGKLDRIHENLRAGKVTDYGEALSDLSTRSETATRDLALTSIATQTAKRIQQGQLSSALLDQNKYIGNQLLHDYAGGIDTENGPASAIAYAVRERRESVGKLISERDQLMYQFKLNGNQYQKYAIGEEVAVGRDSSGHTYTFNFDDEFAREAAIEHQLATGSFEQKLQIIKQSGSTLEPWADTISRAIPKNGLPNSGAFFGGQFIDAVIKGDITDYSAVVKSTTEFIAKGKMKDEVLAGNDGGAIKVFIDAINKGGGQLSPDKQADYATNVEAMRESARVITDESYENYSAILNAKASAETKKQLRRLINRESNPPGWENA